MALAMRDMRLAAGRPEGYPGALRQGHDEHSGMRCRGRFQIDTASECVRMIIALCQSVTLYYQWVTAFRRASPFIRTLWGPTHAFLRVSGRPGVRDRPIFGQNAVCGLAGLQGLQRASKLPISRGFVPARPKNIPLIPPPVFMASHNGQHG